jgi:hypothetical protein
MKKNGDMQLFLKYIVGILVIGFMIYYVFYSREGFLGNQMNPNKEIKIKNKFTKNTKCDEQDFEYCAKWGKVAINNFNQDEGCMCSDMESGV